MKIMMISESLEFIFLPGTDLSRYKIPKVLPLFFSFHLPQDKASDSTVTMPRRRILATQMIVKDNVDAICAIQMCYGILLYSLSCVLSLLPLCVKRQCAVALRTAVNDFSWAILPRRAFIDILMSFHPFAVSDPPASKTDFLPTAGFLP